MEIERIGPLCWAQHKFWFYNEPTFPREWNEELARRLGPDSTTPVADLLRRVQPFAGARFP
jgi:hypothetical protein